MKRNFFICICIAVLAACSPMNLALQGEDWEGHDMLAVSGRTGILVNQKLAFGEYQTLDVRRS